MKKLCCLFAALLMLFSACAVLAEERVAPADRKELVTELAPGVNSLYRIYDARFWEAPSTQPGTIVRFDYTTDVYGETINQWANVYLPYGYDENKQYNIMYFTHGTNETQESFICNEQVKNAVDNMIEMGICEPFIMVCPTYYYEYESRSTDHKVFVTEVRKDLMPAVEAAYSTYAETADDAGFIASREHRAFAGYPSAGRSPMRCMTAPSGSCPWLVEAPATWIVSRKPWPTTASTATMCSITSPSAGNAIWPMKA